MYIASRIRLERILKNTWKVDVLMVISSTAGYLLHDNLIKYHLDIPTIVPSVLGTAIAFFIGFNNNQAYDRWWEARKIWGMLVNDSRTWSRGVIGYINPKSMLGEDQIMAIHSRLVTRHIAFLYALKGYLRGTDDYTYKTYLSAEEVARVSAQSNTHNAILMEQSRDLSQLYDKGYLDGYKFLQLDAMLVKFSDEMGMSERIKNTVFPTTYNYFTKVFIWLFVVSVSLVLSAAMGPWSIFLSWLIGFVFVSTQVNGMSLIDPFKNDAASIPLNQITRTIEINLLEMLGEVNIPEPVRPVNGEYVL
ncbi:MAG: bestrophin family ion channel [Edaphocola sp.]